MKDMKGKMKAALLYARKKPLVVEEVDIPQIGPSEALVKVKACGVCHTDLTAIDGAARNLPRTLGHEVAGDIAEVGEGVTALKIGDRVTVFLRFICGDCLYCMTGRDNLCANMKGKIGSTSDGGYAEYCKAPARVLFKLPKEISYEEGGILACCVGTTYRAIVVRGQVKPGSNVMVQGIGGLGLSSILIAKLVGARVIAVDIRDEKLKFAKQLGAEETVNASKENVVEAVNRLTDGVGVDYVIDLVGTGRAVETALACVGRCGKVVQVGHTAEPFSATSRQFIGGEKEMLGVAANTRSDLVNVINLVQAGRLYVKPIITNEFPLSQVNHALDLLRKGQILGRAVIKM